jgi:hypothetical protein
MIRVNPHTYVSKCLHTYSIRVFTYVFEGGYDLTCLLFELKLKGGYHLTRLLFYLKSIRVCPRFTNVVVVL